MTDEPEDKRLTIEMRKTPASRNLELPGPESSGGMVAEDGSQLLQRDPGHTLGPGSRLSAQAGINVIGAQKFQGSDSIVLANLHATLGGRSPWPDSSSTSTWHGPTSMDFAIKQGS